MSPFLIPILALDYALGREFCEHRLRSNLLFLIWSGNSPDSLERDLGLQIFIKLVVDSKELIYEVILVPEPHFEEQSRNFTNDCGFEPAPAEQQTLIRSNMLHRADESIRHGALQ